MISEKCILYVLIIVSVFLINYGESQKEGEACYHQKKKLSGSCKKLDDCESALDDIYDRDIFPQRCEFTGKGGKIQIVCCPEAKAEVTTTSKTTATKTPQRKSQFYCGEYAKSVYVLKYTVSSVQGAPPKNESQCGFKATPLIFGGTLATAREFPHMALIGYGEEKNIQWNCGGTLISDFWVMTAAHCCYTDYGDAKFVRVGDLNYKITTDQTEPQDFTVVEIKKHPDHTIKNYDDIGLLKLNKKVQFTAYVRPACLWPDFKINASSAIATGWGDIGFFGGKSADLLKVTLRFKSFEECNQTFSIDYRLDKGIVDDKQLCAGAGASDDLKDTCSGDSGGPLQIYAEPEFYCMYYIVGVTSFGKPCAIAKRPSVYVRVSNYLPWIESVVWP